MKRREFIRLTAASIALAAVPVAIVKAASFSPLGFEWFTDMDGYGMRCGLAGQITINGRLWRHALMYDKPLTELTEDDITAGKHAA